ncbi:MAG: GAF domain-containing protein [Bryobacterales bacterium]|nr:GAF domain-containing protein [Bryobacterales bacterium]
MKLLETARSLASQPDRAQKILEAAVAAFGADSGTVHLLGDDGVLHLAASYAIPEPVLRIVATVPVGKGMAGLAVERKQPVTACNIQTDTTGDVRPGARATGMEGAIVVPILRGSEAVGSFGIANRGERTFTPEETALLMEVAARLA